MLAPREGKGTVGRSRSSGSDDADGPGSVHRRRTRRRKTTMGTTLKTGVNITVTGLTTTFFAKSSTVLSRSIRSVTSYSGRVILVTNNHFSGRGASNSRPFNLCHTGCLTSFMITALLFFINNFFSASRTIGGLFTVTRSPTLHSIGRVRLLITFVIIFVDTYLRNCNLRRDVGRTGRHVRHANITRVNIFHF